MQNRLGEFATGVNMGIRLAGACPDFRQRAARAVSRVRNRPLPSNKAAPEKVALRRIGYLLLAAREADPGEAGTEQREGSGFGNWGWI